MKIGTHDGKALADQFGARLAEVDQLFRSTLDANRTRALVDDMRTGFAGSKVSRC